MPRKSTRNAQEGGIRKTVRRINNQQTARQNWEKQMHQLDMAGHLLFVHLYYTEAGHFNDERQGEIYRVC